MANGNGNGRLMPDVHAGATIEAAALATVLIWLVGLAGVTVPGEVGAAITTLCGAAYGVLRGGGYSVQRRHGDPDPGSHTPPPTPAAGG